MSPRRDYNDTGSLEQWPNRYLQHEATELHRWDPPQPGPQQFWRLLKRRATRVQTITRMQQSLTDLGSLQADVDALIEHCGTTVKKIDQALLAQATALGCAAHVRPCQGIPVVGPLTALAMVTTWQRAPFRSDDAFIAFIGMDVQVRESGPFRGRRKLTRKGEPELRRLLFDAAMQGRRNTHWQPCYLALRERGSSRTCRLTVRASVAARAA